MKTVLITGVSGGIGKATALALQAAGYTVWGTVRKRESVQDLIDHGIQVVTLDVTDDASMIAAVKKIGHIDVLVNNAGYGSFGALEEVSIDEARQQMEVNVFGMARLIQLVVPGMRQRKSGKIINIGSMAGKFGEAFGSWYHVSKYAIEGLSDSLALELRPFGIAVITVEPGVIDTKWWEVAADHLEVTSAKGPYKKLAKQKAASFRRMPKKMLASQPKKVAQQIVRIVGTDRPRLRYAVGGGAKPILYLRRILPDKLFYWLFRKFA